MALKKKPHTLTFYAVSENTNSDDVVQPPTFAEAGVEIRGQLTPMDATAAFNKYGVELERPHMWLCDDDDPGIGSTTVGSKATSGSREFYVKTPAEIWNAIPAMSFADILLEEKEYT